MEELKDLMREVLKENAEIIRSDHDLLVEIKGAIQPLVKTAEDHEKRLRVVERALFYGLGAIGAVKILWDVTHKG